MCENCEQKSKDGGYIRVFTNAANRKDRLVSEYCEACYNELKAQNKEDREKILAFVKEAKTALSEESFRVMRDRLIDLICHLQEDPHVPYRPCMG